FIVYSGFGFTAGRTRCDFGERAAHFGAAAATIFSQKNEKIAHRLIVDGVDDGAAFAARTNQFRIRKNQKLRRQRVGGHAKAAGDFACRHARRASLHQKPEYLQPRVLRDGGKALDGRCQFHISLIPEISNQVKRDRRDGDQRVFRNLSTSALNCCGAWMKAKWLTSGSITRPASGIHENMVVGWSWVTISS